MSTAPESSGGRAPSVGLIRIASAIPIPGSATCEIASAASVIRRITAKHPTNPAAVAIAKESTSELISIVVMDVESNPRAVEFAKRLGSQNLLRYSEARIGSAHAQDPLPMLINDPHSVHD